MKKNSFSFSILSIISIFSIIISSAHAYECSNRGVLNYIDSEFMSHVQPSDIQNPQILKSKTYLKYDKFDIFSAKVQVNPEGKIIDIYIVCETGKAYAYQEPSFEELTGIKKISRELWQQMQQTNSEINIIVDSAPSPSLNLQNMENELRNKGMDIRRVDKLETESKYQFLGLATPSEINSIANLEWVAYVNSPMILTGQSGYAGQSNLFFLIIGIFVTIVLLIIVFLWFKKRK